MHSTSGRRGFLFLFTMCLTLVAPCLTGVASAQAPSAAEKKPSSIFDFKNVESEAKPVAPDGRANPPAEGTPKGAPSWTFLIACAPEAKEIRKVFLLQMHDIVRQKERLPENYGASVLILQGKELSRSGPSLTLLNTQGRADLMKWIETPARPFDTKSDLVKAVASALEAKPEVLMIMSDGTHLNAESAEGVVRLCVRVGVRVQLMTPPAAENDVHVAAHAKRIVVGTGGGLPRFSKSSFDSYVRRIASGELPDVPPPAGAERKNLLPNPSFEEIDGKVPRGWRPHTWKGTGEMTLDPTVVRTGKNSLRIHSDTGFNASWFFQWHDMKPNTRYRASVWIKTANLKLLDGKGVCMNHHGTYEKSELITRDGDWRQVTMDLETGTRKLVQINLNLGYVGQAKGTAWFDDVELYELGPSAQTPPAVAGPAPPAVPATPPAASPVVSADANPAAAPAPVPRQLLPVPDAATIARKRALMLEVMANEFKNATSPGNRKALAHRLFDAALGNTGDAAERYVLLAEARDQAVRASDFGLIESAIDHLAGEFDVRPLDLKVDAMDAAMALAKAAGDFSGLARSVDPLVDQAIDAENYAIAKRLVQLLTVAAARGKERELSLTAQAKSKELTQITALHKDYVEALKVLESAPKDAKARLAAGRYMCLVQGDWDKGLALLSDDGVATQDSFAALRTAARKDAAQPVETAAQKALADTWWSLAEDKSEATKPRTRMRERAAHWYWIVLPQLPEGLERRVIESRLAQVPTPKTLSRPTMNSVANPPATSTGPIKLPQNPTKPELVPREETDLLISVDARGHPQDELTLRSAAQGVETHATRGGILIARRLWDQSDVLMTHPHQPTHPARIDFTGVARLGPGQIRLALRCLPNADTRAVLKINERRVWSLDVNGKEWLLAEINFKQGERVVVEHQASGWMSEFLFLSYQTKLSRVNNPGEPPAFDFTQAKDATAAQASQQAWAKHLGVPFKSELDTQGVKLAVTLIPPSVYHMGSPAGAVEPPADERQQLTAISRPFLMGTTEVTRAQFERFVKETGYKTLAERLGQMGTVTRSGAVTGASWRQPDFAQQPDHPVVGIAWADGMAFCDWLSKRVGRTVRLPTEAEWELACRAGTTTRYPWGDDPGDGKGWANVADLSTEAKLPWRPGGWGWDDGHAFTAPVGAFRPNAFGIHDMIGSSWEWTSDRHRSYPRGMATDPVGATTGWCTIRGGSWADPAQSCRSAKRVYVPPNFCHSHTGLRVVVPVLPEPPARHRAMVAKLALGDTGLVLTTADNQGRAAIAKDDGSVGQLWLLLEEGDDLILTNLVSAKAVDVPLMPGKGLSDQPAEDLLLYQETATINQRWTWLGEGRDKAIQSRYKDRVLHARTDGYVVLMPHDPKSQAQRWRIVEAK